eukprot:CAMPEP_0169432072 /NCGR_PEP_ID=MMETSP1042-20121227/3286_1 /TAXON_ID=464988 /ORGANISM="Hemiselmis andersenii, Strain CCMP1180" /LENGTH=93 /DNA_ID=CAMNT_0009542527 /DNA_START=17 /DNA_END=295 /DNA_ORIENTATION=+
MAEDAEEAVVAAALDLILSTDNLAGTDVPDEASTTEAGPSRGFHKDTWLSFCQRVEAGTVRPTCNIDFAYSAAGTLNLKGDDRQLERMYCFFD